MGKLIVIDGLDGSGKNTQAKLLYSRLRVMGKDVHLVSFPDYESESSKAVRMYLNGELGRDPASLNPYLCSLFYAVDRGIQFTQTLNEIYNRPDSILICDRYLSANIIHQGGKIQNTYEQKRFFEWIYDLEVGRIKLPLEDITIVLSLPVEVSQKLLSNRYNHHEEKKDIHEENVKYMQLCYDTMDKAVEHLSSIGFNWVKIDCTDENNEIKSRESISEDIWQIVKDII